MHLTITFAITYNVFFTKIHDLIENYVLTIILFFLCYFLRDLNHIFTDQMTFYPHG